MLATTTTGTTSPKEYGIIVLAPLVKPAMDPMQLVRAVCADRLGNGRPRKSGSGQYEGHEVTAVILPKPFNPRLQDMCAAGLGLANSVVEKSRLVGHCRFAHGVALNDPLFIEQHDQFLLGAAGGAAEHADNRDVAHRIK